jgi:DNA primase
VPGLVSAEDVDALGENAFEVPAYRAVHHAIRAAGGVATAVTLTPAAWTDAVREEAAETVVPLVTQLAVAPLPADTEDRLRRYAASVVLRVAEVEVTRQIGTLRSRVQRMDPDDPNLLVALGELTAAEGRRRALKDRITGAV